MLGRSRDRMVVLFTTTCTYAISATDGFDSRRGWGVQHYVIKFISNLRQVGGFLRILRFPPRYNWNIVGSRFKHHKTNKRSILFQPTCK